MFIHSVYFWLKPNLTSAELAQFKLGVEALLKIPSVKQGAVGTPAKTDRPVIDRTYSFGLMVAFENMEGHDAYQVHPIHDAFRELSHMWTQIKIYDFE